MERNLVAPGRHRLPNIAVLASRAQRRRPSHWWATCCKTQLSRQPDRHSQTSLQTQPSDNDSRGGLGILHTHFTLTAKAGMVHSVSGLTRRRAGLTVRSIDNACHTRAAVRLCSGVLSLRGAISGVRDFTFYLYPRAKILSLKSSQVCYWHILEYRAIHGAWKLLKTAICTAQTMYSIWH